ncbi:PREDICTED: transposon, partial [Prunus dulcis]
SIFGTLLNIPGKTKDGVAAREDLVKLGVRIGLAPQVGENRTFLSPSMGALNKKEKISMCKALMGIKVPEGYSSNIRNV